MSEPLTDEELNQLAVYDAERERGLVHDLLWMARMRELQERADAIERDNYGNNILAESEDSGQDEGESNDDGDDSYDLPSAIASDLSSDGRSVLIGVIVKRDAFGDDHKLHGYLDETLSADKAVICSAGYLFRPSLARRFRKVWRKYLKSKGMLETGFHANECFQRPDWEEISSELASLIKKTATIGFVKYADPAALHEVDRNIRHWSGSAYSMCTLGCMQMMADYAKQQRKHVAYFIEDGHEYAGELRHFLHDIEDSPDLMEQYAMVTANTYKKRFVTQFQAADLFAWSYGRSTFRGALIDSMVRLIDGQKIRHVKSPLSVTNAIIQAMANSFYSMESRHKILDYEKHYRISEIRPHDA